LKITITTLCVLTHDTLFYPYLRQLLQRIIMNTLVATDESTSISERGRVAELGKPKDLLRKPDSLFGAMVRFQGGEEMVRTLLGAD
jgi:hypothetical protein